MHITLNLQLLAFTHKHINPSGAWDSISLEINKNTLGN
uniref:Uncharacterized protein n=1 Tax=Anguilla anguilla TaxID=7936 RepID=A0A0E9QFL1_ANGAN